jgi:AraC-like DNA-binding protein
MRAYFPAEGNFNLQIVSTIPLTGRQVTLVTRIQLPESWCSRLLQSVIDHEGRLPRMKAAQILFLSPVQFSRNFRKVFGCSFRTAQVFLRLHLAAHYLRHTALRISDIADRLHYGDLKKFERAFKQHFHMNPRQYRRRENSQEAEDTTWVLLDRSLQEAKNKTSLSNTDSIWSDRMVA